MNKMLSLAAIVLAASVGAAAIPALAGQPAMPRQMPGNGTATTMGHMGNRMMGGSMMGRGMMDGGAMRGGMMSYGRGMMGGGMMGMMAGTMDHRCESMMQAMNGGPPNSQWHRPQSQSRGMPD